MTRLEDRQILMRCIAQARADGSRLAPACALAGLGGVAAAPMTTAYLGMGIGVIVDAFVVVVIGGLGSIGGSMVGSLIVGAAQTWGAFYLPETAMVIMYAVMGAILIFRPWGLFGEEE